MKVTAMPAFIGFLILFIFVVVLILIIVAHAQCTIRTVAVAVAVAAAASRSLTLHSVIVKVFGSLRKRNRVVCVLRSLAGDGCLPVSIVW